MAARMAEWLVRSKSLRPLARAWLERHPDAAARDLVPAALGKPGRGRSAAEAGLRLLDQVGQRDTIRAAAGGHGDEARRAIEAGLRAKAREKMDEVADSLGLTAEQLADRLVPDLGLDRDGSMVLDYGGRRFDVGFDEQLKPVVADEDGSRRKVLPGWDRRRLGSDWRERIDVAGHAASRDAEVPSDSLEVPTAQLLERSVGQTFRLGALRYHAAHGQRPLGRRPPPAARHRRAAVSRGPCASDIERSFPG